MDHETIDDTLAASESSRASYHFYRAIRRKQADHATRSVQPLGKLDVFLDPSNGPSRTAYVNRKGMLITASSDQKINPVVPRRRVTWTDYTAVVTPQIDEGDLWVRSMESPAHNAIQPDQLPEPKQQQEAKTVFANVRRQLRAIVDSEMAARHAEVSENLSELAQYLPEEEGGGPSERHLAVTRIQARPQDPPEPDLTDEEEMDVGETPQRSVSSGGLGDNGRVEGESGDLIGRRRRAVPRIPVQDPRAIPVNANQVRISFTPRLGGRRPIAVTLHPRGYEATVEAAIPVSEAECLSSDLTACTLLDGSRVRLIPEPHERIIMLFTTSEPIEQMSAFDLSVRETQ